MTDHAAPAGYLVREAAISAVINAAISAGFFFALFGLGAAVPVWGIGNFAFDFLPQGLAVAFFASFVPSLLATRATAAGKMAGASEREPVAALFMQSLARGIAALAIGGAIGTALLWLTGVEAMSAPTALAVKIAYGFMLGAAVTYRTLSRLLSARAPG